ncbi:MAG: nucleotidyltransferase family protein, partial [Muribaculaceae bacterium]|nr:nucleotidyltransferase family protein [Muribaculaceae bacterium]
IFLPKAKHYGCWVNGIRIELHRIAGQLYTDSDDMKFQKWSRIQFSITDKIITIAGQEIMLPTPIFDIIFVFLHLYHHFLNGGVGLRHICDWTMLLHRHAGNIDTEELRKLLKDFHLMNGWSLFAPIAVEHLGLRESECPFYYHKNKKKSDQILSYIIREGNFGRAMQNSSLRPKGYIAGKAYSFLRHSKKLVPKIWIDPYILSQIYGKYAISGTTRVIKDIIKKKYTVIS